MKLLPDKSIDLTVTSPPYDEIRTCYASLPLAKFEQVAKELLRITKPGGVVVWVVQEQVKDGSQTGTSSEQRLCFRNIGFRLFDGLIMARHGMRVQPERRYGTPFEEAFILSNGNPNVWHYATGRYAAEETWVRKAAHGAIMPEKMAEDLILCYSKPDDLVFDPFCGLATTCKMALLNHRRYLGMEIDQKYHRLAEKRMTLAEMKYRQKLDGLMSA